MRGAFSTETEGKVAVVASLGLVTKPSEGDGLEEKMTPIRRIVEKHLMVAIFELLD